MGHTVAIVLQIVQLFGGHSNYNITIIILIFINLMLSLSDVWTNLIRVVE